MSTDPLDDVFTLEDQFFTQGFNTGFQDGIKAGRIEGRSLGMQKGFEKFFQGGRLAGQSIVLLNRLPQTQKSLEKDHPLPASSRDTNQQATEQSCTLPPLQSNTRLEKNVGTLYALVEPETFSTENTDEAVQDFDDRFKRAQGKAKIIERMINQELKSTGE